MPRSRCQYCRTVLETTKGAARKTCLADACQAQLRTDKLAMKQQQRVERAVDSGYDSAWYGLTHGAARSYLRWLDDTEDYNVIPT